MPRVSTTATRKPAAKKPATTKKPAPHLVRPGTVVNAPQDVDTAGVEPITPPPVVAFKQPRVKAAPVAVEPEEEEEEAPEYEPEDLVTLLRGYGRVPTSDVTYLDQIRFVGGVARNVPYRVVEPLLRLPIGKSIVVLPNNPSPEQIARTSGTVPVAQLATGLAGANMDDLFRALGLESSAYLVKELTQRLRQVAGQAS